MTTAEEQEEMMLNSQFQIGSLDDDDDDDDDIDYGQTNLMILPSIPSAADDTDDDHRRSTSDGSHIETNRASDVTSFSPGSNSSNASSRIFKANVDLSGIEAAIVSPGNFREGDILRIDMGSSSAGGDILIAQIPPGGVKEGDTFHALYKMYNEGNNRNSRSINDGKGKKKTTTKNMKSDAKKKRQKMSSEWRPNNEWKSRLFGCCEYGCCHPSFVHSFLGSCYCVIVAQVANRVGVNWMGISTISGLGEDTSVHTQLQQNYTSRRTLLRNTFITIVFLFTMFHLVIITLCYILLLISNDTDGENDHPKEEEVNNNDPTTDYDDANTVYLILGIVVLVFYVYTLVLLLRLRHAVRESYGIISSSSTSNNNKNKRERHRHNMLIDCCVVCLCRPCALSQMARQTTNYKERDAKWFTETGISETYDAADFGIEIPVNTIIEDREMEII